MESLTRLLSHLKCRPQQTVVCFFHYYEPKRKEGVWLELCKQLFWIEIELESQVRVSQSDVHGGDKRS